MHSCHNRRAPALSDTMRRLSSSSAMHHTHRRESSLALAGVRPEGAPVISASLRAYDRRPSRRRWRSGIFLISHVARFRMPGRPTAHVRATGIGQKAGACHAG
jgi:hypothetical protein